MATKYRVRSGDLNAEVDAESRKEAAVKAMADHEGCLGLAVEVKGSAPGDKKVTFHDTESLLREAGLWDEA